VVWKHTKIDDVGIIDRAQQVPQRFSGSKDARIVGRNCDPRLQGDRVRVHRSLLWTFIYFLCNANAGALPDQPLAHPVQRLQIKLVCGFGGDEFHRRTLHRLGDCLRVAEVVFLPFAVRAYVFRRHQPRIVTVRLQLAAQVMRANTSLHPDQALRHVPRLGRATTFAAARLRRVDQGRRCETSSYRYRCPSWRRSQLICWTLAVLLRNPVQRHALTV
jgi:hypothetical protein